MFLILGANSGHKPVLSDTFGVPNILSEHSCSCNCGREVCQCMNHGNEACSTMMSVEGSSVCSIHCVGGFEDDLNGKQ